MQTSFLFLFYLLYKYLLSIYFDLEKIAGRHPEAIRIRWLKYQNFSFSISPSNEYNP